MPISDKFTVAAAFGNVHGVYAGDIELRPPILDSAQKYISDKVRSCEERSDELEMRQLRSQFVCAGSLKPKHAILFLRYVILTR